MSILIIITFFVLIYILKSIFPGPGGLNQSTSLALGFLLITAFLFGKIVKKWKLPMITGFMLMGIICGPYLLKLINFQEVKNLRLLDGLALSLIALTAGGELKLEILKQRKKAIILIIFFQALFLFFGFLIFCFLCKDFSSFFPTENLNHIFAFGLLFGVLSIATSPSTTIAIITETRAKGSLTDLVLSVTVFKDVIVIILFAISFSFSRFLISGKADFSFSYFLNLFMEIAGSLILGIIVGLIIIFYLKFVKSEITIFILSIAFFTYELSYYFELHPLLICMIAGFLTENFSSEGEKLIHTIEKSSLPIYVIFFAISGASLNLEVLKTTWIIALSMVFLRAVFKFIGTYLGAKLSGEESNIQKLSWMGFISQAGVALGLAIIIERSFPQWGAQFKTLAIAVITINQIIGPIMFQKIIFKSGEAGKKKI